jgi:glycosyltransferase involved in cell wall biosynthesis
MSMPFRPLTIALLGTRGVPARYGGFETFAEQLSVRLVARGHRVTVYGRCGVWGKWGAQEPYRGVERRDMPTVFHKYLETPLHALSSFIDLLRQPIDIALVCNGANSPFLPIIKAKGVPVLVNVDGIERERAKWNALGKAWYLLGERCSVWWASQVVSDANVIADYYRDTYGCQSIVIPYGVHPVERAPGDVLARFGLQAKRYLLYVSRLEPENNALGVIEAYKHACERGTVDMPLVIVGDAPYAAEYKARLHQSAQGYSVIFTGFQFGDAYQELQSNCFCYVQATEVGGTHPALIEAMSYGNCVIVNGTPENLEVVGDVGMSFSKNNFEELAEILVMLCRDEPRVRELGAKARERALREYSWDSIVDRYEQAFFSLVSAPRVVAETLRG